VIAYAVLPVARKLHWLWGMSRKQGPNTSDENKLTIKLTVEQQKQIMDATGASITELNLAIASTGRLSERELDKVAGGASEAAVVVLEFEEGNPDKPIVTGSVYNAS
jgi:hypothetical protein